MPFLNVLTNVDEANVPPSFLKDSTDLIAKILSKPSQYVAVNITAGAKLKFGGSEDPAAIVDLTSIGKLGVEENKGHSEAIAEHMEKHLGINAKRMYIIFHDMQRHEVGYSKSTF